MKQNQNTREKQTSPMSGGCPLCNRNNFQNGHIEAHNNHPPESTLNGTPCCINGQSSCFVVSGI